MTLSFKLTQGVLPERQKKRRTSAEAQQVEDPYSYGPIQVFQNDLGTIRKNLPQTLDAQEIAGEMSTEVLCSIADGLQKDQSGRQASVQ